MVQNDGWESTRRKAKQRAGVFRMPRTIPGCSIVRWSLFRGSSKRRQPLRYGESEPAFLLLAEDHFALAHQLVVEPEAVFVGRGFAAGARRSAEQADSRGRLKNVRGKRAAVHVKLDTQVSRVGNPRNLVAGIQHHGLRNQSNQYRAFCHFVFHPDGRIRTISPRRSNPQ